VSFFFFFTFGFMMQDIAYGIILLVGCLLILKLRKPRGDFRGMLKMFALCGISTIFAGALFGGFFGDLPQSFAQNMLGYEGEVDIALWFSPLKDPMTMLYFSLGVGIVQVLCGICVSAYMKFKNHDVYAAFADDISWLLLFVGGGLSFVLSGIASTVALCVAGLGAAMVILMKAKGVKNPIVRVFKGLIGIYGIVNYASDILSYSRIMALGLSGAVIANVMNLLGTLNGPTFAGWIMFTLLLIVGTVLNLFISVLGAFVHTARLQYIEFFGKFYDEGGKPFAPLKPVEKFYVIENNK
jgi:V/A-type H+-transporting ATPase subunit I